MRRKANWEEVLESERRMAEFFNDGIVGLAIFDERLHYRMVNPYLAASNGTPIESHLGRHVQEILGNVGLQVEAAIRQVFVTSKPVLNCIVSGAFPSRPRGGRWIDSFFPIMDSSGRVKSVGVVVLELAKDRRLELVREDAVYVNHVLRSWKDIAQYMGTCVKTVQRWERTYDLPVRRIQPGKGSVVVAFRNEVDEWLQKRTHDLDTAEPRIGRHSRD
ncbi:MAG: PAS domain-containing protein [Acidobacteriota bacterium]